VTARTTFEGTVKTAAQTQLTTLAANELTKQETINQSGVNVGYNPNNATSGQFTTYNNAVIAANKAKYLADQAAEAAKQASIAQARDTLRNSGDVGPT
jgi:hypothetical protein